MPPPPRWSLALVLLLAVCPGPSAGVTIYRFGGADLPPPPEAGRAGVEFRQLDWGQLGDQGESSEVSLFGPWLGPVAYSAAVPLDVSSTRLDLRPLFDKDLTTVWMAPPYACDRCSRYGEQGTISIDLPDRVFVDRVQVRSGGGGLGVVADLAVYLSPSGLGDSRTPRTPVAAEIRDNREPILNIAGFPADQRSAAVQIQLAEHVHPYVIADVVVYGRGAPSQASYRSDIIDFGGPALWGQARWSLSAAPGSSATLTTRSGDDAEVYRYWRYTGIGDQKLPVTRDEYLKLRSSERAGTTYNYDSWSQWQPPFDLADPGAPPPLVSRPRQTFQFQLDFGATGREGARLEYLEFRASEAAVSDVVGELDPVRVQAGATTAFTYTLKPRVQSRDPGFDRLQLRAVAARILELHAVRVDGLPVPFSTQTQQDHSLLIALPRVGPDQSDALVELAFDAQVLRYGAAFAALLEDSRRPFDVPQPVPAGDAHDEALGDRVWIETTVAVRSVLDVAATPPVLTPNGDGANDRVQIAYDLFETTGGVPLRVEILDLAGRRRTTVHDADEVIGHYQVWWDGRDDAGALVPPGIYLYRVVARVGGRVGGQNFVRSGVLQVAY